MSCYGPSIKYVTLFWTNFDHVPLSRIVTHPGTPPPLKYVTHLGTPQFLVVHAYIHMFLQGGCLTSTGFVYGGFVRGAFCLEAFCVVGFCPSPFCQNIPVATES